MWSSCHWRVSQRDSSFQFFLWNNLGLPLIGIIGSFCKPSKSSCRKTIASGSRILYSSNVQETTVAGCRLEIDKNGSARHFRRIQASFSHTSSIATETAGFHWYVTTPFGSFLPCVVMPTFGSWRHCCLQRRIQNYGQFSMTDIIAMPMCKWLVKWSIQVKLDLISAFCWYNGLLLRRW